MIRVMAWWSGKRAVDGRPVRGRARQAATFRNPGRVIALSFATAIAVGTALLSLPIATESRQSATLLDALFTATSAVCVTGLITVDTGSYWSPFGEIVILALIQVGGLGIMTLGTLVVVVLSRRLGLRARLIAQAQSRTLSLQDVRRVVRNVVLFTLASEAVVTAILSIRLATAYPTTVGTAVYDGLFHAISAFNNAGFSTHVDSLVRYVADPWVMLTVAAAVILGGIGFPVVFELARAWRRPKSWSVTTRITVITTLLLLAVATIVFIVVERDNPETLGPMPPGGKLLAGFFTAVMPRTAGFNAIDIAALRPESLLLTDALMFIGGGSAATAGGIKVTTFGLLAFVIWAEIRGEAGVEVGLRRVPARNQREALAVALLGIGLVAVGTFALLGLTAHSLDLVLFEVISALGTVGLSAGITADLPDTGKLLLILLMYLGRIGPLSLFSALALRERGHRYERPEEQTIVG
jgi:trk system potassium uptake protein TrkH